MWIDDRGAQITALICTQIVCKSLSFIYFIMSLQLFSLCIWALKMAKNHRKNILIRTIEGFLQFLCVRCLCLIFVCTAEHQTRSRNVSNTTLMCTECCHLERTTLDHKVCLRKNSFAHLLLQIKSLKSLHLEAFTV